VARTVNTTQVVANWLIGRVIVEEEQQGKKRAGYGKQLVEDLSQRLTDEFGSGYSTLNLWLFRRFYVEFPELIAAGILYAPPKEFADAIGNAASENVLVQREMEEWPRCVSY
jgi:hypothetical protein